jgi:hypothetical protein
MCEDLTIAAKVSYFIRLTGPKTHKKSPAFSREKAELKSQFCKIDTL